MARDRQRAKQRQAERRAARQAAGGPGAGVPRPGDEPVDGAAGPNGDTTHPDGGDGAGAGVRTDGRDDASERGRRRAQRAATRAERDPDPDPDPAVPPGAGGQAGADLAVGAPPEAIGRGDSVVERPPPAPDLETDDDDLDATEPGPAEREEELPRDHNRVVAFLIAVWAELKRVQWPNRQQVTTLTGIVIGFVVIMGAYLGALDAIFGQLVQAII